MLEQKRISTKINYDVLKDLNKSSLKSPTRHPEEGSAGAKSTPAARQRKPLLTSPSIGKTISSFGKRYGVAGERFLMSRFISVFLSFFFFWICFCPHTLNHTFCSRKSSKLTICPSQSSTISYPSMMRKNLFLLKKVLSLPAAAAMSDWTSCWFGFYFFFVWTKVAPPTEKSYWSKKKKKILCIAVN